MGVCAEILDFMQNLCNFCHVDFIQKSWIFTMKLNPCGFVVNPYGFFINPCGLFCIEIQNFTMKLMNLYGFVMNPCGFYTDIMDFYHETDESLWICHESMWVCHKSMWILYQNPGFYHELMNPCEVIMNISSSTHTMQCWCQNSEFI